jgi:hypothetical protein
MDRFWEKIQKSEDGCWLWTGATNAKGYGKIQAGGRGEPYLTATHVVWAIHHGPVPPGMRVLHHCDVPRCCRIDHLFIGTPADNMRDKVEKGRHIFGEAVPSSILTTEDVIEIRRRYEAGGVKMSELAAEHDVCTTAIQNLIRRRTWKHVT